MPATKTTKSEDQSEDKKAISLSPRAPFDFRFSARFFSARSSIPLGAGKTANEDSLTLYDIFDNSPQRIQIKSTGSVDRPRLAVAWAPVKNGQVQGGGKAASSQAITKRLNRLFMLDLKLKPFYQTLTKDRHVQSFAKEFRGLKPVLTPSLFDAAIWAIVGQQITVTFARTLKSRLAEKYGQKIDTESGSFSLGPDICRLARARKSSLLKLQLSKQKADYALGLARLIDSGKLDLDALCGLPYDEALAKLMEIRGIGEWSASYILLRGAGALDALPLGDAGLKRAIEERYKMSSRPSREEIIRRAERHRPYRSLYTLYLWRGLG